MAPETEEVTTAIAIVEPRGKEIDVLRTEGSTSIEEARQLAAAIKDPKTLEAAAKYMLTAKAKGKAVKERLAGPKAKAKAAYQEWIDLEKELLAPYTAIEDDIIKPAMSRYDDEQERLRREEQRRRDEAERKRLEDEQLERAKEAADQGNAEEAEEILNEPVVAPPVVIPKAAAPAGISYRLVWRFKITDPEKIPRQYLMVDETKIGAVVRAMKGETAIEGIQVYSEKVVAGRV